MGEIKPKFIDTEAGAELVILTRAEFDGLMARLAEAEEDAEDAALFDERMAAVSTGDDDKLPAEVSAALLKGKGLLRALREWRGMTQVQLATAVGLAQPYLSDLESKRRGGTIETMERLARALDVDPNWLRP